jgi:hypothetical protein
MNFRMAKPALGLGRVKTHRAPGFPVLGMLAKPVDVPVNSNFRIGSSTSFRA